MKKSAKATGAIVELCRLGLPSELLVPAVLEALHDVVPSCRNLFDWTDESGRLLHYYFEGAIDPTIAQLYFDEFHNRREGEAMPPFAALTAQPGGVRSARTLDTPGFFASALYHEIWKPQGLEYRVEAVLRGRRGQLLGSLVLYRSAGDRCFSAEEESRVAQLLPALAAALERTPVDARGFGERTVATEPAETLVIDEHGRPQQATAGALRLLMLADGAISPYTLQRMPERIGHGLIDQLRRRLEAAGSAQTTLLRDNAFGRFVLQARRLAPLPAAAAAPAQTLITLQRQEPRAVALERALRSLELTPGQHRVCRELALGTPQSDIAERLGVAPATVADQVAKIYRSVGVRTRGELRECIERRVAGQA